MSSRTSNLLKSIFFFLLTAVLIGSKKLGFIASDASWAVVAFILCLGLAILYLRQAIKK